MQERGYLQSREPCQEPVEAVKVRSVEVVGEPAGALASRRPVDHGNKQAAGVASNAKDAQAQREPDAAESVRHSRPTMPSTAARPMRTYCGIIHHRLIGRVKYF